MGVLFKQSELSSVKTGNSQIDYLHRFECKVCPLNKATHLKCPKVEPQGNDRPLIYILSPNVDEKVDRTGKQSNIYSRDIILNYISQHFEDFDSRDFRWNTLTRCRPIAGKDTTEVELECCRPSIIRDIEISKPEVIFGFGYQVCKWVLGNSRIDDWRGRQVPVTIGNHTCWFFPFLDPKLLFRSSEKDKRKLKATEDTFYFDMKRSLEFLSHADSENVFVFPKEQAFDNIYCFEGKRGDLEKINTHLRRMSKYNLVGFDIENYPLRPYKDGIILSLSLSVKDFTISIAWDHKDAKWSISEREQLQEMIVDFLFNFEGRKSVHNLSHEFEWLAILWDRSLLRAGRWDCTQAMAYVLDERLGKGKPGCHSLEFQCIENYGISIKGLVGVDRKDLRQEPLDKLLLYNGLDAKFHNLINVALTRRLKREGLYEFYIDIHLRRLSTLVLTQIKGVPLYLPYIKRFNEILKESAEKAKLIIASLRSVKQFERVFKSKFNPSSNPNVTVLFDKVLGVAEDLKDENGKICTDKNALAKVDNPFCTALLKFREINKTLSTYSSNYLPGSDIVYEDPVWGYCLHPRLNSLIASTGRTSSEEPNSQNFPKRTDNAKYVRKQFRSESDEYVVLSLDYGQIEARIIGIATRCKVLCDSIVQDYDIHMDWAKKIAHAYPRRIGGKKFINDKDTIKKFRADVKNQWVFPAFYNSTANNIASNINVPVEIVNDLFEEFWQEFEEVKTWQDQQIEYYNEHGYVCTLTGRRRRYPLTSNMIVNSPIQGTASDIAVDAMDRLSEMSYRLQPNMYIHDDLTFWVKKKHFDKYCKIIVTEMLRPSFDFLTTPVYDDVIVPISVEVSRGTDLSNGKEIAVYTSDKWNF